METNRTNGYLSGFVPFALAAFLVGIIGGFTTVLGPDFVRSMNLDYNNTTWTALAMATATATFAPILGKLGDAIGRRNTLLIGVAVFVPLFTNRVTANVAKGLNEVAAAVNSVRLISIIEVICVVAGIFIVLLLPEIHKKNKGEKI